MTSLSHFDVPELFWEGFVRELWEQRPAVLTSPLSQPIATRAEAFAALVHAAECMRRRDKIQIRLFLERGLQQSGIEPLLPRAADGDLRSYAARVEAQAGRPFGLVLNHLQTRQPELLARSRRFVRGLFTRVGMPSDYADTDIFAGNYRLTPFGVHKDRASNFCFVLEGRKRFRVWPYEALAHRAPNIPRHGNGRLDDADLSADLGRSMVLEAGPGEIIYWPSTYWHVAESDGDLSMCFNVALYLGTDEFSHAAYDIEQLMQEHVGRGRVPRATHRFSSELPAEIEAAAARAADAVARKDVLLSRLRRTWLERSTGMAFQATPPAAPAAPLGDGAVLLRDPAEPLAWLADGEALVVSAWGRSFTVSDHPRVRALLERVRAPGRHRLSELEAMAGDAVIGGEVVEVSREDIRVLLQNLVALRALEREAA